MNDPKPLLHAHKPIVDCDPQSVLDQEEKFPGAAILVAELKHYYDYAMKITFGQSGSASAKVLAEHLKNPQSFPDGLAKEVRQQLNHLQDSALLFEALGKEEQAKEVRAVASTISTMYKTIEQSRQIELTASTHR